MTATVSSLTYLRAMLSECTAFQEWCGEPDAANALERIYPYQLPAPEDGKYWTRAELETYRPFAIVRLPEGPSLTWNFAAQNAATESGRLEILLEQSIPGERRPYVPTDHIQVWQEAVEEIVRGSVSKSTTGILDKCHPADAGHLDCTDVRLIGQWPSSFQEDNETGRYFRAILEVRS